MPSSAAAREIGLPARTSAMARARNSAGNGLGMVHSLPARPELHTLRGNPDVGQVKESTKVWADPTILSGG